MTKEELLNKLTANLEKHKAAFEETSDNPQFRNIAFGSAGYLSKASKSRLYKSRETIGKVCDKIAYTELCIKIVNGETFTHYDIYKVANNFLSLRNPEIVDSLSTPIFSLYDLKVMMNTIFEIYSVPYRKQVLQYNLKYMNDSGTAMDIPLAMAERVSA